MPGVSVTFAAPASGASAALSSSTATTGTNGQASVTATANTIAGSYTVTASVAGVTTPASFSLTNTPGTPASVAVSSGSGQSATVDQVFASPLVALVDRHVRQPGAGRERHLRRTHVGGLGRPEQLDGHDRRQRPGERHGHGQHGRRQLHRDRLGRGRHDPGQLQPDQHARRGGVGGGGLRLGPVDRRSPRASPARWSSWSTTSYGNPVPGASVTFAAPASGASAALTGSTATTGANGQAERHGHGQHDRREPTRVTASVAGVTTPASFSLTNNPGAAAAVAVVSGSCQSATVTQGFASPLVVVVEDTLRQPGAGRERHLRRTDGGRRGLPEQRDGHDRRQRPGERHGHGQHGRRDLHRDGLGRGHHDPASFSLTNTPGAAAAVAVVSGSGQTTTVATAFASPLVVVVKDSYGNPVPGASVTFAAPTAGASAALTSSPATTGANGQASVTATANTVAGAYTVTASVAGVTTPASFSLTNNARHGGGSRGGLRLGPVGDGAQRFGSPLVVMVKDSYGNLVPGASVIFAAPASGATAS